MKSFSKKVESLLSRVRGGERAAKDYLRLKRVDRDLTNVKKGDLIPDVGAGLALDDFLYANKGATCICLDINKKKLENG